MCGHAYALSHAWVCSTGLKEDLTASDLMDGRSGQVVADATAMKVAESICIIFVVEIYLKFTTILP